MGETKRTFYAFFKYGGGKWTCPKIYWHLNTVLNKRKRTEMLGFVTAWERIRAHNKKEAMIQAEKIADYMQKAKQT